jgi:alkylation response protein AidB-like acyl-CoA dehydrogenase
MNQTVGAPATLVPDLDELHNALRRDARKFAEGRIAPMADALDQADAELPQDLIDDMGKMGYFGLTIPEEYGGQGQDALSAVIVTEELVRAWSSAGRVLSRTFLTAHILQKAGTEEQKRRFLPGMAAGTLQTAWAGTEAEAGSDAAAVKTLAVRRGDRYVINGVKMFCTWANRANLLFVFTRTDPDAETKHRGISCIVVEKPSGQFDPPRLVGDRLPMVGYHGMYTYQLGFSDMETPANNLIGEEPGKGFYQLMQGYELGRATVAATAIGLAQAAIDAALAYVPTRRQFGLPISEYQAVRLKLADMATDIAAARQLTYSLCAKITAGVRCDMDAGMAKLFATEMALRHTWNALALHGGNGYSMGYPLQRFWRDSAVLTIGEGTSDIQRLLIARRLLGER